MFAATCVLLAALGHLLMSDRGVPWWAVAAAFGATTAIAWRLAARERGVLVVTSAAVAAQAVMHSGFSLAQAAVHPSVSDHGSLARQWVRYLLSGAIESGPSPQSESVSVSVSVSELPSVAGTVHSGHLHPVPEGSSTMTSPVGPEHAHHAMQGMADNAADAVNSVMPVGHDMGGMSPAGMLSAHLLAALLCGLWLAHGEQAAFRVLRSFAAWLIAPLRLPLRLAPPPHRPRIRARRARRACALRRLLLVHAITMRGPPPGTAVI
ncbi:hypothetical protein ACIQMR_18535 [Streptomyces sp. NPDC091376]|uniref:hypothetical protein n=1 Tax=Streptomyces sp. NPDC091376 TaxID=3365994 RepID=UPI0038284DA3